MRLQRGIAGRSSWQARLPLTLIVALLTGIVAGCAADPTETGLQKGIIYSVDALIDDAKLTLADGRFGDVDEFVRANGITLDEASANRGSAGLPWLLAQNVDAAELDARFADFPPSGVRDPIVLSVISGRASGTVQLFVRIGTTDSVGFGPHLYVYFVCVDMAIDLDSKTANGQRVDCPVLPATLTKDAKELPDGVTIFDQNLPHR